MGSYTRYADKRFGILFAYGWVAQGSGGKKIKTKRNRSTSNSSRCWIKYGKSKQNFA